MIHKLNKELTDLLHQGGSSPLPVIDPTDNQVYAIVSPDNLSDEAKRKLKLQMDIAAIQQGKDEIDRGLGIPLAEAMKLARERILASSKK